MAAKDRTKTGKTPSSKPYKITTRTVDGKKTVSAQMTSGTPGKGGTVRYNSTYANGVRHRTKMKTGETAAGSQYESHSVLGSRGKKPVKRSTSVDYGPDSGHTIVSGTSKAKKNGRLGKPKKSVSGGEYFH